MSQLLTITQTRPDSTVLWYSETEGAASNPDALSIYELTSANINENKISFWYDELSEDGTQFVQALVILDPTSVWGPSGYVEEEVINKIVFPAMKEYNLLNNITVSIQLTDM